MTRRFISAAVSILLLAGLAGCATDLGRGMIKELKENKEGIRQELGELWDAFLEEANEWAESFAAQSVTADRDLAGRRERGGDNYVGSYQAGYSGFNGKEYIFGGTAVKRTDGSDLCAVYSLTVLSGTARLYHLNGSEELLLADVSGEGTYEFTIHAGKNFLVLEGTRFTGSLSLSVVSEKSGG